MKANKGVLLLHTVTIGQYNLCSLFVYFYLKVFRAMLSYVEFYLSGVSGISRSSTSITTW